MNLLNLIFKTAYAATVEGIIDKVIDDAIEPFIGLLMVLATVVFIWGVIEFVNSEGAEKGRTQGKNHMLWGILGLFIMSATAGILWVIVRFWRDVG